MRLLAISPGYIPIPSGAEISLHQTLLCYNSLECMVLTISDNPTLTDFFKVEEFEIITKKNTFLLTPPMQGWEYTENKADNYITIVNPILRKGGDAQ